MKIRAPDDEGIQAENMKNETDDSSTKVWQNMSTCKYIYDVNKE